MDVAESAPSGVANPAETFCQYLARQLVAVEGFTPGAPAELHEIAAQCDDVLSSSDGHSSVFVALIDREAHPDKAFTLAATHVREIAEAYRVAADRAGRPEKAVAIHLVEVGDATPDQAQRLGDITPRFLDNFVAAWAVDPRASTIWTTAGWGGRAMRSSIRRLLDNPREGVLAPAVVAIAPHAFPWLTAAMVVLLVAIFAAEIAFGPEQAGALLQPTTTTLIAFGGLMGSLVVGSGEWYRLFTGPLLHGGIDHVALNAAALGLAGYVLESLIGRAWFAALFVIGALCGALFSLAFNASNLVAVGASGAGMALFACMLVLSRRFPKGAARRRLQMTAVYVLLPSLLPLTSALRGMQIDYAAHFGGAFGGIAVGLVLLALWPGSETRPHRRGAATVIALAGLAGVLAAGVLARRDYPVWELYAAFVPQNLVPTTEDAWRRQAADLAARFPRDPRVQFIHGLALAEAGDGPGAERALRAGLAEQALWRRILTDRPIAENMHAALALVLKDSGREEEAREVARPGCLLEIGNPLRAALDQQKLCAR